MTLEEYIRGDSKKEFEPLTLDSLEEIEKELKTKTKIRIRRELYPF